jgi:signal transduction histidine kinase
VRVQPALFGQLVDNLLDNACKYSPPGTPIRVRVEADDSGVTLAVEDGGPGVAAEDVPQLFEPFFRSAQARRQGVAGVGLGLAVARRIAGAFGGTLTLDAAPGQGARFVLRLPAAAG